MLNVKCEEYLAQVREFADTLGEDIRAQLEEKLSYLENYAGGQHECALFKDFAPHSFVFNMHTVAKDGERKFWFNGGLIFHEARSSGAEYPVLSVTIDPQDKAHWNVHT